MVQDVGRAESDLLHLAAPHGRGADCLDLYMWQWRPEGVEAVRILRPQGRSSTGCLMLDSLLFHADHPPNEVVVFTCSPIAAMAATEAPLHAASKPAAPWPWPLIGRGTSVEKTLPRRKAFRHSVPKTATLFGIWLCLLPLLGCQWEKDRLLKEELASIRHERVLAALRDWETPAPIPRRTATIVVLPAEIAHQQNDGDHTSIEHWYFAAGLVEAMRRDPWVAEAYWAPATTPAADWTVSLTLTGVNPYGARIVCRVRDVSGKTYSDIECTLSIRPFAQRDKDAYDEAWRRLSNRLGNLWASVAAQDFMSARTVAYGEPGIDPSNPKVQSVVSKVATIERQKLLGPVTSLYLAAKSKAQPSYLQFCKGSLRLQQKMDAVQQEIRSLKEQQAEARRQASVQQAMDMLQGIASVAAGNAPDYSLINSQAYQEHLGRSEEYRRLADQQRDSLREIEAAGRQFQEEFRGAAQPLTITIDDQAYELTGRIEAQLQQIRDAARNAMRKQVSR